MINRDYIGRSFPPGEPYEVGREKIREFADAIGDPNPVFRDPAVARAVGHPDVLAPPTFPIVVSRDALADVVADPTLNVDYSRVVHGEQQFTYTRPVYPGDRLVGAVTVENIRSVGRNEMITACCDVSTEAGEHVCVARHTLVVRG